MAKYKGEISQAAIDRKVKEGRGAGEGHNYLPWLTAPEVPSLGRTHQIAGWKTNERDHHLLSDGELYCFYLFEWPLNIIDIREQFPLPLDATLEIAKEMGIEHPKHPKSKHPIVMTTDFLLTLQKNEQIFYRPVSFKYASDLNVKGMRTAEKLEIERIYWQSVKSFPWSIATDRQLPMTLIRNVGVIHNALTLKHYDITQNELDDIASWLTPRIQPQDTALRHLTSDCDANLGFQVGTSLKAVYHFIAKRRWIIDMDIAIDPGKPLVVKDL